VSSFHSKLFPLIWPLLEPNGSEGQINTGLCIMDDIIADGEDAGQQYVTKFLPYAVQYSKSDLIALCHSGVFGIGACAMSIKTSMPNVEECLSIVIGHLSAAGNLQERDSEDEKNPCLDNCISVIGKIAANCFTGEPQFQGQSLFNVWLSFLPVQPDGDEVEAQNVHTLLCDLVLANNQYLLGPNGANLPKIIGVLSTIIGSAVVTDATMEKMIDIWRVVKQSMPQLVEPILSCLNEQQKVKLQSLIQHV